MKPQKCHKRIRPQIINRPAVACAQLADWLCECVPCVCVLVCGKVLQVSCHQQGILLLCFRPLATPLRSVATYSQCANICIFKLVVVVVLVVAMLDVALLIVVVVQRCSAC